MPEALETWPVDLFSNLLPRIYMIVEEIDRRFRIQLNERYPGDTGKIEYMSILSGGVVKMANFAVVGSFSVNGVAEVHSNLLKSEVMKDLYDFFPEKFNNKTNGVTHRRWLIHANHGLSDIITDAIGTKWKKNPIELEKLAAFKDDSALLDRLFANKRACKENLAEIVEERCGVKLDPSSIFDVQVKRLHEYKRQQLNALDIIATWQYLRDNPNADFVPHTFIFGAKAAPGYFLAKQIIKLICEISNTIERDPVIREKMRVVFLEEYNVTMSELLMPASDISEQISLAGTEASGTGNMKLMLNGALTLGTLDGANVEIREHVGDENIFIFGMTARDVVALKQNGYNPQTYYARNDVLRCAVNSLLDGFGSTKFPDIYSALASIDQFMTLADFDSYRPTATSPSGAVCRL
jgi:starch phosphorylase